MKLTPLEIKKARFHRRFRGYDRQEVEALLDMVSTDVEDLLRQNREMHDQLVSLETQLSDFRQIEKSLQQTLRQAEEMSAAIQEQAKRQAEGIVRDAESKAQQIIEKARADLLRAQTEISVLRTKRELLHAQLKTLLASELDLLKALELDNEAELQEHLSQGTGKEILDIQEIVKKVTESASGGSISPSDTVEP